MCLARSDRSTAYEEAHTSLAQQAGAATAGAPFRGWDGRKVGQAAMATGAHGAAVTPKPARDFEPLATGRDVAPYVPALDPRPHSKEAVCMEGPLAVLAEANAASAGVPDLDAAGTSVPLSWPVVVPTVACLLTDGCMFAGLDYILRHGADALGAEGEPGWFDDAMVANGKVYWVTLRDAPLGQLASVAAPAGGFCGAGGTEAGTAVQRKRPDLLALRLQRTGGRWKATDAIIFEVRHRRPRPVAAARRWSDTMVNDRWTRTTMSVGARFQRRAGTCS